MVRRTKRTKRRRIKRRTQRGGKETVGYFLALDGFPNAPGASRVDSYSSCSRPAVSLPLDSAFLQSSGALPQGGGRKRRRRTRRRKRSRKRSRRSRKRSRTRRRRKTRKMRGGAACSPASKGGTSQFGYQNVTYDARQPFWDGHQN